MTGHSALRKFLHELDPTCHWCGTVTILRETKGGRLNDEDATIDHYFSRYHLTERKRWGNPVVISCYRCNHDRGQKETKEQPMIELWIRSGHIVDKEKIELAWAAGFFDGEGHISTNSDRGWLRMSLSINQIDREVLDRFNTATGNLGKVYGPYEFKNSKSPQYKYQVNRMNNIKMIVQELMPFLSTVKKEQCSRALKKFEER